jgi:hypothetical protein
MSAPGDGPVSAGWTFRTRAWRRPGYTAFEGSASCDGQTANVFLLVGSNHVSADVQSLRGLADRLFGLLSGILGVPATGPIVVNIGELMDSLDEIPMNATWSFAPPERESIERALEALLWAGVPVAGLSIQEAQS